MSGSTQDTNLSKVVKPTAEKLTSAQNKTMAAYTVANMTQSLKAKSINQVLWGNKKKG
jgi:hypothetical protein